MLRKMLLLSVAVVAIGACTAAPPPAPLPVDTAADEAKMKADLQKWFDDVNAGNLDAVAAQYAEDAVMMPPNAPVAIGRAAIKAALDRDFTPARAAGLTIKSSSTTGIGVNGDTAWMSGTYVLTDPKGTTVDVGKYLSVHRKTSGAWLYIRDTWNSDNPPPPPAPATKK